MIKRHQVTLNEPGLGPALVNVIRESDLLEAVAELTKPKQFGPPDKERRVKVDEISTPICPHCGPVCYGGAAHNARVEDGVMYEPLMQTDCTCGVCDGSYARKELALADKVAKAIATTYHTTFNKEPNWLACASAAITAVRAESVPHEHKMRHCDPGSDETLCACGYQEGAAVGYKPEPMWKEREALLRQLAIDEPAPNVVEEMQQIYKKTHDRYNVPYPDFDPDRLAMSAAYEKARPIIEAERDKQWEKAIGMVWEVFPEHQWTLGSFVSECRKRLSQPKEPTLQEKVEAMLRRRLHADVNTPQIDVMSAEIIALVRAEIEKEGK